MPLSTEISEILQKKLKYGMNLAPNMRISSSRMKAKVLKILKNGMNLTAAVSNASISRILPIWRLSFHFGQPAATITTAVMPYSPLWSTGTAVLFLTIRGMRLQC